VELLKLLRDVSSLRELRMVNWRGVEAAGALADGVTGVWFNHGVALLLARTGAGLASAAGAGGVAAWLERTLLEDRMMIVEEVRGFPLRGVTVGAGAASLLPASDDEVAGAAPVVVRTLLRSGGRRGVRGGSVLTVGATAGTVGEELGATDAAGACGPRTGTAGAVD
jgi:hypothetical protein